MKISLRSWNNSSECSLTDPAVLEYVKDKPFKVTYIKGGVRTIAEFTVTRANSSAVLCRTKKGGVSLIDTGELIEMEELAPPVVIPKLSVRSLSVQPLDQVRQHLFDRHGILSTEIPTDATKASALHDLLHATPHLGHRHGPRDLPRVAVPSEAEITARTDELNKLYESALACDSCSYVRLAEEDGRSFSRYKVETANTSGLHCSECKDPDEFDYE